MKKQMLKSALIALAGVGLMSSVALALPVLPPDYSYSSADYWTSTQTDSDFEISVWKDGTVNTFGLYSTTNNGTQIGDELDVFNQYWVTLYDNNNWDLKAVVKFTWNGSSYDARSYVGNTLVDTALNFGDVFGFYIDRDSGSNWYTDTNFNTGNAERIYIGYNANTDNAIIYAINNEGSVKFQADAIDIAPVPEPTTMLLFGTGLASLASIARRRKNN